MVANKKQNKKTKIDWGGKYRFIGLIDQLLDEIWLPPQNKKQTKKSIILISAFPPSFLEKNAESKSK